MNVLKEEVNNEVYSIIFNRPDRKNALNTELLIALQRALENAAGEGSSVVVIRGSGGSFCAGGDIGEFSELVHEGKSLDDGAEILHRCILLIRKLNAITIAVLEGVVVGAGIGISLACDLSIAAKGAVMNMAYRRIGLTPDGGGSILLSRIIGAKRSNELYFLARNVGMEEARGMGLVNFVWAEEELEAGLKQLITDLIAFPTETIGRFKDLTNDAVFAGLQAHLDKERFYLSELGGKPDFEEQIERFFGKNKG